MDAMSIEVQERINLLEAAVALIYRKNKKCRVLPEMNLRKLRTKMFFFTRCMKNTMGSTEKLLFVILKSFTNIYMMTYGK